ncbi:MAG: hypothetical protein Q9227_004651 [Pyrenula ochraceoflavens]
MPCVMRPFEFFALTPSPNLPSNTHERPYRERQWKRKAKKWHIHKHELPWVLSILQSQTKQHNITVQDIIADPKLLHRVLSPIWDRDYPDIDRMTRDKSFRNYRRRLKNAAKRAEPGASDAAASEYNSDAAESSHNLPPPSSSSSATAINASSMAPSTYLSSPPTTTAPATNELTPSPLPPQPPHHHNPSSPTARTSISYPEHIYSAFGPALKLHKPPFLAPSHRPPPPPPPSSSNQNTSIRIAEDVLTVDVEGGREEVLGGRLGEGVERMGMGMAMAYPESVYEAFGPGLGVHDRRRGRGRGSG